MGNKKWKYSILANDAIDSLIEAHKKSLRIEVCDGMPHLQVLLRSNGELNYKTLGRIRRDKLKSLDIIEMESQPIYINVRWFKFQKYGHTID